MSLTLKIISPATLPAGQLPEFTFDENGGSIGRKPNNDFILVDPERFISSQHASISCKNGAFIITDTSTNGVFINNSRRPIGNGNSEELNDGDKISIGEFQLETILAHAAKPSTAWDNIPEPAALGDDILGGDILGNSIPGPAAGDSFNFDEPFLSNNASENSIDSVDPLALLGGDLSGQNDAAPLSSPMSSTPSAQTNTPRHSENIDLFAEDNNDDFFSGLSDNNPHQNIPEPLPINEPFTPPTAIPDDWDIMGDNSADNIATANPPKTAATGAPVSNQTSQASQSSDPLFENTAFEQTTPLIPDGDSLFEDDIFAALEAPVSSEQPNVVSPPPATPAAQPAVAIPTANMATSPVAPAQVATPSMSNPVNAAPPADNNALINAFIKGVGIDPAQINASNPEDLMLKIGQLTRISTEGLMMALRARATIKSSFRVNKTIIAPIENNPLKFSVTSEDALNVIFSDEKAGYMPATEAFSEGFKDLQSHQMAMMAGMQGTIKAITHQFSPQNLEQKFESKQSGSSFIPGNKKAKNWEMYELFYKKISATLQDDFQNVYGEEFARAYENQIRKLS